MTVALKEAVKRRRSDGLVSEDLVLGGDVQVITTDHAASSGVTITAYKLYYLDNDGWKEWDPDTSACAVNRIGLALGSDPETDGMLLRGPVTNGSWTWGATSAGAPLYGAASGGMTETCPSESGNPSEVLRIVATVESATKVRLDPTPGGVLDSGSSA